MKVVHDISHLNLADVPRRLRDLAREIEEVGDPVLACVVVIEYEQSGLTMPTFGRDADQLRTIGLLSMAQTQLSAQWLSRESIRDPEPAA